MPANHKNGLIFSLYSGDKFFPRLEKKIECKKDGQNTKIDCIFPVIGVSPVISPARITKEIGDQKGYQPPGPERIR